MMHTRLLIRRLSDIPAIPTAHHVGLKQVLLANSETPSAITQIAMSQFTKGESVEPHLHPTMDEHYLFLEGSGKMTIDGETYPLQAGDFILIPAGTKHDLVALEDMRFVTVGVAL